MGQGAPRINDKKGSTDEESAFWKNFTGKKGGLIAEEREG